MTKTKEILNFLARNKTSLSISAILILSAVGCSPTPQPSHANETPTLPKTTATITETAVATKVPSIPTPPPIPLYFSSIAIDAPCDGHLVSTGKGDITTANFPNIHRLVAASFFDTSRKSAVIVVPANQGDFAVSISGTENYFLAAYPSHNYYYLDPNLGLQQIKSKMKQ